MGYKREVLRDLPWDMRVEKVLQKMAMDSSVPFQALRNLIHVDKENLIVYLPYAYHFSLRNVLVDFYRDTEFPITDGVINPGNLQFALESLPYVHNRKGDRERKITRKAAFLMFQIASGHPFADGNKRTSLLLTNAFMEHNSLTIGHLPLEETEELVLGVARGECGEKECFDFLTSRIRPLDQRLIAEIEKLIKEKTG
ncbi:MAG: type II toxin-antitoxin system death-on-curing family toxin [archaeon]